MADMESHVPDVDEEDSSCRVTRTRTRSAESPKGNHVDPSYQRKLLKLSGISIDSDEFGVKTKARTKDYAKVLVLYTGGTIGMCSHGGVYEPEPNFLVPELRKLPVCHDASYVHEVSTPGLQAESMPLVMPLSKDSRRIIYCVYEYEPLLDSANMTFDDYARLATDIEENYDRFDSFVILHGTDTMAYTASALSFMLENLGKPVVLTGSQIPIFEIRSDGRDNFLGALIMAGNYDIPEVTIYFHNMLIRGNRATKIDAEALDAFHSPNLPPLAELEVNITVHWNAVFRHRGPQKLNAHTTMCPDVGILRLFPSITKQTVQSFLQPPMRGVVIQSYGAGNGPSARKDLLEVFTEATSRGMIIVNITQCSRGTVSTAYETGKALLDSGVIPGSDMTCEAALMKLSYVLSTDHWTDEQKREMMMVNLRGEMKVAKKERPYQTQVDLIDKIAEMLRIGSEEEMSKLQETIFPSLTCAAAHQGNVEAIQNLKRAGAPLWVGDYAGRTPLHIAASQGHLNMVRYLINCGCSVHVRDQYGRSPLDDAVRFNRHEIIKLLMQTGAHLVLPSEKLGMVLCSLAQHEEVASMESWHLAGANLNQCDYSGRTALHVAIAKGSLALVNYLLMLGVQTNIRDGFGHTALDEARKHNRKDIVVKILEAGVGNSEAS